WECGSWCTAASPPMKRPDRVSMAVSALALTAIAAVVAPLPAASAGPCSDIHNEAKKQKCKDSLLPETYSIHDMGMHEYGGGSKTWNGTVRSVAKLRGPDGTPDVSYTLRTAYERTKVAERRQRVFTINGKTPGPTITAEKGDLIRVVLRNRNIDAGTTIHWHGVDVPNGEDGVAGVTQNAVLPGQKFVYRFKASDVGTYWYHSHQYSEQQVTKGLVGAIVIQPRNTPVPAATARDVTALVHSYRGRNTINGSTGSRTVSGDIGGRRIRFVNTNQTSARVASSVPYRVVAVDGAEVNGPTLVQPDTHVDVPAAGRVDIVLDAAATSARVGLVGGPSLVLGSGSPPKLATNNVVDLLSYGAPDPTVSIPTPDRRFNYVIGQKAGYLDGKYGTWFTINGELIPHVPMYMVKPNETVRVRFQNNTSVDHPMHPHGQHMRVLSRNGVPSSGSPWVVDTLEVHPGEEFVVQMQTDNPGDWMFHCHILAHANDGLVTHLSYLNVRNPFRIGVISRRLTNHPE
ncbi:MAG: multicopper oxidase family protein, partial [Actinomycetes bacterium]